MDEKLSGADELRLIIQNINTNSESFNDKYSLEQLIKIFRTHLKSKWDFYPDEWTKRQIKEALINDIIPDWNDDETPKYK